DEGAGVLASIVEVLTIGREAKLPVHISHLKAFGPKTWGKGAEEIALIEHARRIGQRVSADQYPYAASSTQLAAELVPPQFREGKAEDLLARLSDAEQGPRMRHAIEARMKDLRAGESIRIARYAAKSKWQGKTLGQIASQEKKTPLAIVVEILRHG